MDRCARCHGELQPLTVFCPHCAQAHEPELDRLIALDSAEGPYIGGRYRIYRRLGGGGLSTLFAATDLRSDRVVALKISDPRHLVRREMSYALGAAETRAYWAEMLERMRREAEILAAIDHPNIVRFYGSGMINEDLRYVAMEFLRGRTLREELDANGRIAAEDALRVGRDVAEALREVHRRDIVHRDINPQNIFLDCGIEEPARMPASIVREPNAVVKLIDFGIAKFPQPPGAPPFTHHSAIGGTVAYASPEQCQNRALDQRADIYSLGIVLYEMLTGQRPFNGRTPTEIALRHLQETPAPLRSLNADLPGPLDRAVLRALSKSPDDRQQTIEELAEALRLGANPIVIPLQTGAPDAKPAEPLEPLEEAAPAPVAPARRRLGRGIAFAAGLLALLAASAWGLSWLNRSAANSVRSALASVARILPSPSPTQAPGTGRSDADALEQAARTAGAKPAANPATAAPTRELPARNVEPARPAATRPTPQPPAPIRQAPLLRSAPTPQFAAQSAPPALSAAASPPPTSSMPAATPAAAKASERPREIARAAPPPRDEEPERQDEPSFGPRLIQWSGAVNGRREIRIEMPGGPGRIEIPRTFRDRVGLVEPPNPDNNWRYAVLRVFGNGHVSFVLRWWPNLGAGNRFAARD